MKGRLSWNYSSFFFSLHSRSSFGQRIPKRQASSEPSSPLSSANNLPFRNTDCICSRYFSACQKRLFDKLKQIPNMKGTLLGRKSFSLVFHCSKTISPLVTAVTVFPLFAKGLSLLCSRLSPSVRDFFTASFYGIHFRLRCLI